VLFSGGQVDINTLQRLDDMTGSLSCGNSWLRPPRARSMDLAHHGWLTILEDKSVVENRIKTFLVEARTVKKCGC